MGDPIGKYSHGGIESAKNDDGAIVPAGTSSEAYKLQAGRYFIVQYWGGATPGRERIVYVKKCFRRKIQVDDGSETRTKDFIRRRVGRVRPYTPPVCNIAARTRSRGKHD